MLRRRFLTSSAPALAALSNLMGKGLPTHFPAKAKRMIYLFQSGGPSQIELFDYKPQLVKYANQNLPDSIRNGQRLTGMSATQSSFPVVPSRFGFKQYGSSGAWIGDLLPYTAKIADDITIIRSLHTEAINHDPRPPRLRRHDLPRSRRRGPTSLRSPLGLRLPPQQIPGREVPLRR